MPIQLTNTLSGLALNYESGGLFLVATGSPSAPSITIAGVTGGTRYLTSQSVTGVLTGVVSNTAGGGADSFTPSYSSTGSLTVSGYANTGTTPIAPGGRPQTDGPAKKNCGWWLETTVEAVSLV